VYLLTKHLVVTELFLKSCSLPLTYHHFIYFQGYRVFYCLASQSDQPIESWSLYPTVNNLAVLDNLITDEEYSVSVQARNRIGTGPASQPIQFTVTPGGKAIKVDTSCQFSNWGSCLWQFTGTNLMCVYVKKLL